MNRQIEISTDVFAAIWSFREAGEDSEDQILHRILSEHWQRKNDHVKGVNRKGYVDRRHDVQFSEGFEIFRTYKGVEFKAIATNGGWISQNDGKFYRSINALSRSIVDGNENAWENWKFITPEGVVRKISDLRDQSKVAQRRTSGESSSANPLHNTGDHEGIWRGDIVQALENLGGKGHLTEIYKEVEKIRRARNASIPESFEAIIRRELENNSSDSESFTGRFNLFYSVEGLGNGVWGLRVEG